MPDSRSFYPPEFRSCGTKGDNSPHPENVGKIKALVAASAKSCGQPAGVSVSGLFDIIFQLS